MKKPTGLAAAGIAVPISVKLDDASMSDIAQALADGRVNATALTRALPRAHRGL